MRTGVVVEAVRPVDDEMISVVLLECRDDALRPARGGIPFLPDVGSHFVSRLPRQNRGILCVWNLAIRVHVRHELSYIGLARGKLSSP